MDKTYRVVRFYQDGHPQLVIAEGLSLAQAQDWCRSPETSSATASEPDNVAHTGEHGPWFDGYREEQ